MNFSAGSDDDPIVTGIRRLQCRNRERDRRRPGNIHLVLLPLIRGHCRSHNLHEKRRTLAHQQSLGRRLDAKNDIGDGKIGRINLHDSGSAGDRYRAAGDDYRVARFVRKLDRGVGQRRRRRTGDSHIVLPPLVGRRRRAGRLHREPDFGADINILAFRLGLNRDGAGRRSRHHSLADRVVPAVGDEHISGGVDRDPVGRGETNGVARPLGGARDPRKSGDRAHRSSRRNFANRGVARISHVKRAGAVRRNTGWAAETGTQTQAVRTALRTRKSGQRGDRARTGDFANRMVVGVGDVNVARPVDGEPARVIETRVGAVTVCSAGIGAVATGERADHAARRDLADRVVARIGHVNISRRIDRDPIGGGKFRSGAHVIHTARTACGARESGNHPA